MQDSWLNGFHSCNMEKNVEMVGCSKEEGAIIFVFHLETGFY